MTVMRMKNISVMVACLLLFSSLDVLAQNNNNDAAAPAECCFTYRAARLDKKLVASFQRTHLHCARDGVVFTMQKGAKFCTDPSQAWVQNLITHVESKKP